MNKKELFRFMVVALIVVAILLFARSMDGDAAYAHDEQIQPAITVVITVVCPCCQATPTAVPMTCGGILPSATVATRAPGRITATVSSVSDPIDPPPPPVAATKTPVPDPKKHCDNGYNGPDDDCKIHGKQPNKDETATPRAKRQ